MSGNKSMAENEVIEIDGKRYTKVQIEDHNEEFLMDEDNKIYDMNLQLVGVQGDSDEDDNF
jgi:carbonic anhydrase